MKSSILILLASILFTVCKGQITVNLDFRNGNPAKVVSLCLPDSIISISLDKTGCATYKLTLDEKHFGYGRIIHGFAQTSLFFYKDFDCSVSLNSTRPKTIFTGKGKKLNQHVEELNVVKESIYLLDEQEFVKQINERYAQVLKKLDSIDFPESFRRTEEIRLKLFDAYVVCSYPQFHASETRQAVTEPSAAYYKLLDSYLIDDPAVLKHIQSQSRLVEVTKKSAVMKLPDSRDPREEVEVVINYILEKFTHPEVRSYLVQNVISGYTSRYGITNLGTLKKIFDETVQDPEAKRQLDNLYIQTEKIHPGAPSPEFTYKDINDKTVTLSSLKGKYVFIDVWATWCSPCCKEIPHMAALEHKYKDRNIHFVSISVDRDRKAWQKMVHDKNMQGIQLNTNRDATFEEAYMISLIPRFILIDPEGRIVNAKMPPPSNPMTTQILNELKGL